MRRNDFILIAALIFISVSPIFFMQNKNDFAVVKVDGVVIRRFSLNQDEIFVIETDGGKNVVEIKNGTVSVAEADCPDKICVKTGAIKNVGEVIACVPHKVLIEIAGD